MANTNTQKRPIPRESVALMHALRKRVDIWRWNIRTISTSRIVMMLSLRLNAMQIAHAGNQTIMNSRNMNPIASNKSVKANKENQTGRQTSKKIRATNIGQNNVCSLKQTNFTFRFESTHMSSPVWPKDRGNTGNDSIIESSKLTQT